MTAKKVLLASFSIIALFIVTLIALAFFIDVNSYKPRIEAAASDALGMDVKINGKMRIVLFPGLGITTENISIHNRGTELLAAEEVKLGLKLFPLIKREVYINEIELIKPKFFIERERGGSFSFETGRKPEKKEEFLAALFNVERVFISQGDLLYRDKLTTRKTELNNFGITIKNLSFARDGGTPLLRNISFEGVFTCKKIKTKEMEVRNLVFPLKGKEGIFDIDPITMNLFGGIEKGSVTIDATGETSHFTMRYSASKFRFEKLLSAFSKKEVMKGEMDFSLILSTKGKSADEIKRNMNGEVILSGAHTLLTTLDIDRLLSKIGESRNFNLVDMGAFFFAGPLGTALTKGYDFMGAYSATGEGEGKVETLVSKWKVKNGVAEAEDVALATKQNRVAMKGRLNFIDGKYEDVVVAALNEKGCAKFSQKIHGYFRDPKVERISPLESFTKPFITLFEKTKRFVTGGKCAVFYAGSVKHPK